MVAKTKESTKVSKAREKIRQKMISDEKLMTPEALKKMAILIHKQVENNPEHISLDKKEVTLFDENRHSAKIESKFINRLMDHLKNPSQKTKKAGFKESKLKGRVTSSN